MFNFYAFFPCLTEFNPDEILTQFKAKYSDEFDFYSIENSCIKNSSNSNISVKCNLDFTSGYIDVWKDGYRQEHGGNLIGIDPIIAALKTRHEIEIFSTGICKVTIQNIEETENTIDELHWHYYNIIEKLVDEALLLNYSIAALAERGKGEFYYQRIVEISFPHVFGKDYDISHLINEMRQQLFMLAEKGMMHISDDLRGVIQDIQPKCSLIRRCGYEDLVRIHTKLSGLNRVSEMYEISINRMNSNVHNDNWNKVIEATTYISKYFRYLEEQVRFALSLYSDYNGNVGVYASLIGIGAGLAFFSVGLEDKTAKSGLAVAGLFVTSVDIIFWLKLNTKNLMIERLSSAIENLQVAV